MSLSSLLSSSRTTLQSEALAAITYAEGKAWHKSSPSEVDLIRAMILDGVPDLVTRWSPSFSAHGLTVSILGIVCHARPKVQPNGSTTASWTLCELGDLLVVVEDATSTASTYNSLLLQAKLYTGLPKTLTTSGDRNQCVLYTNWGAWDYQVASFGAGPPHDRDVTPSSAHAGAQYLLMDGANSPWSSAHLDVIVPSPGLSMSGGPGFAAELTNMLDGTSGRQFVDSATAAGTRDWDQVMWDLIRTTQTSFSGKALVSAGDQILATAALAAFEGGDGSGGGAESYVGFADQGINLIRIRITRAG